MSLCATSYPNQTTWLLTVIWPVTTNRSAFRLEQPVAWAIKRFIRTLTSYYKAMLFGSFGSVGTSGAGGVVGSAEGVVGVTVASGVGTGDVVPSCGPEPF